MNAVIFDFDGTIVDSLAAVIKVYEDLMKKPRRFSKEEIEELQHKDLLQIALELNIPKWKIPWLLFRGRRMFRSHMRSVKVHEGMPEVIADLHDRGVPLYVLSSNGTSNVQKYLQWNNLDKYFLAVYGGAGLLGKARKLHKLFAQEGVTAEGSWYVGDETRDIIGAKAADLKIVAVSWGYNSRQALLDREPDELADTPEELAKVLKELWKK
ncbi:HAD hydrolase-like protein [Candidatus Saccharibacteria bacterium]|nr:HAD hydrolase-like protein [Candidatus Saccharibacteria bacterium]